MQGTRWAVAIFVLCLGWTSVRGQQVLSVSAGGLTRSYTTSDLLGRPDVRTVSTRRDDAYRQAMTYQAIPLSSLFAGLGLDPDAYLEVVALDGYVSEIPVGLVLNAEPAKPIAALAVEDPAHPWPVIPGEGAERRADLRNLDWRGRRFYPRRPLAISGCIYRRGSLSRRSLATTRGIILDVRRRRWT